jgi:DNA modification methylase
VPTIRLDHLTEAQTRALIIADNKLAENAGWNRGLLAIELGYLLSADPNLEVTVTGFEIAEIDVLLEEFSGDAGVEDELSLELADEAVSTDGDLWILGKHRILCGNALLADSYDRLMGRRKADLVFTDPPYNVRIDGHATGNGNIRHREFAMASGEMTEQEFVTFLTMSLGNMARHSRTGSVHFVCMDWIHIQELLSAGSQVFDRLLNLCVWSKNNGGMGSLYRSQHELVFVYKHGKTPHLNNVQLGKFGRYRTNVWSYPGVNTMSKQSEEGNLLALHPTVKPIAMVADALLDVSGRGDVVLDGFLGSGTTLMAAERVGRICYGLEIDPLYVDVAIRRWQRLTGEPAKNSVSGKSFDEIVCEQEAKGER